MNRRCSGIFIFNLEAISNLVFVSLVDLEPVDVDKKTGFPSTLNFPAIQKQTYVTKKCPFYISRTLPLISRLLSERSSKVFSVDFNSIDTNDILDINKYLMKIT